LPIKPKYAAAALVVATGLLAAGCGSTSHTAAPSPSSSSTPSSTSSTGSTSPTTSATSTNGVTTASSFTLDFSAMKALAGLAKQGKGMIGVILPDTTSSARYTEFDQPYLDEAFKDAGLPPSDYIVQNAQGSDATALSDAEADIAKGATVLAIDPEDPSGGIAITNYARAHGVKIIDYDRLTLGSKAPYYVSFNNVQVGKLIGQGLVSCVAAWGIKKPDVIVMHGAATDNNATLFAAGYDAVIDPYFSSGKWTLAARTADTWTPPTALTEFEQAYTAHPGANAALIPNDETGAPIIAYLQSKGIKPRSFPTTGQDATLVGLQNIISGYQCGTAYKPIYEEAQATAALALYLRAGKTPPSGLLNGTTTDPTDGYKVPSVLLTPEWVTPANMGQTVVKDGFVPASQLCAGKFAADCTKYGIS
jgi:D-xylose transport system substrate-binding protein